MARKRVADLLVEVPADTGVGRIYGVPGDSLNGVTDYIRAGNTQWIHVRREKQLLLPQGRKPTYRHIGRLRWELRSRESPLNQLRLSGQTTIGDALSIWRTQEKRAA